MIWPPPERFLPVPRLPEPEPFHLFPRVAHGRIAIHVALQVDIDELLYVCPHNLVGIDKDDLVEVLREEHVEEENLVSARQYCPLQGTQETDVRPDDALFLGLSSQPVRPFVRDELVFEAVFLGQVRQECLDVSVADLTYKIMELTMKDGDKKFSCNASAGTCAMKCQCCSDSR